MKRTKQAYFRPNPTLGETKDLSGVTFVFGQDNNFHERTKQYQLQQKQQLDKQIQQKQQQRQAQSLANKSQHQQLLQINRFRGQLELSKHQHLTNMEKACDDFNLQKLEQIKSKQKQQRQQQLEEERRQIELLNQRNVKRYIPGRKN